MLIELSPRASKRLRKSRPAVVWAILLLGFAKTPTRAHFVFSYAGAESIGVVDAGLPSIGSGNATPSVGGQTRHDYLRFQPFEPGYTWLYRGTINNGRTTAPAELRVEVITAERAGTGSNSSVAYSLRHSLAFGNSRATTVIRGTVNHQGDFVQEAETTPNDLRLDTIRHTFLAEGMQQAPRKLTETSLPTNGDFFGEISSHALVNETRGRLSSSGLGARMQSDRFRSGGVTVPLGTYETLYFTQRLSIGPIGGLNPTRDAGGRIIGFPIFEVSPPIITITTHYAAEIGPVRLSWTQTETGRMPITGLLELVETNFPSAPRPLRVPAIAANPMPKALEPGATLRLVTAVDGILSWGSNYTTPSATAFTADNGVQYVWSTPAGPRWTSGPVYQLSNITPADEGDYRLDVVAPSGTASTAATRVTITPIGAAPARLLNVASRAPSGIVSRSIIAGTVLQGAGDATRPLLVPAIGPALRDFGIQEAETDPVLVVYDSEQREIARCDDWDVSPDNAQRVLAATRQAGTFTLSTGSRDAALVLDLPPGAYTAQLLTAADNPAAIGLIEIYDLGTGSTPGPRIANLSTRSHVGAGDEILIPGIVIRENAARVLVRALGPALKAYGVEDVLSDPEITLYHGDTPVASNDDWGQQDAVISTGTPIPLPPFTGPQPDLWQATRQVGAPPLANGSRDAALVATLPPGNYTLHIRSRNPDESGVAVAEVYLVSP